MNITTYFYTEQSIKKIIKKIIVFYFFEIREENIRVKTKIKDIKILKKIIWVIQSKNSSKLKINENISSDILNYYFILSSI